jgi:pimeloyl-ACP methyl ester carboxylesterase
LLETAGLEKFARLWGEQPLFHSQRALAPEQLQAQQRTRLGSSALGLVRAITTLGLAEMPNYWPFLSAIDRPVTLVVGELDDKFRTLQSQMLAQLPQARALVAPRSGHNVVLEAPDFLVQHLREELGL